MTKKTVILMALLLSNFKVVLGQVSKIDAQVDSVISSYEYTHDQRKTSGLSDMELGKSDFGTYKANNQTIHLYQFRGSSDNAKLSHYLIITNNQIKSCQIFEGQNLKSDLLILFGYLKDKAKLMSATEKNRLILDFVSHW